VKKLKEVCHSASFSHYNMKGKFSVSAEVLSQEVNGETVLLDLEGGLFLRGLWNYADRTNFSTMIDLIT